jgi:predicted GNAT family N-acyltransferase
LTKIAGIIAGAMASRSAPAAAPVRHRRAKIGAWRFAPHRRAGVGRALLERMEADAAEGATAIVLHAQDRALAFYARCGYRVEGEGFEEAGIPHHRMRKTLDESRRKN